MSVNCVNCGAPNEDGRKKCAYCGSTLTSANPGPQGMGPQPQYQPPPFQQPPYQPQQPGQYGQPVFVQPVMMPGLPPPGPPKNLVAAALLAFFLGSLGIHNFYLGYTGKGVAQLLLTLLGWVVFMLGPIVAGIWALVEFIMILTRSYPDRWGRPLI